MQVLTPAAAASITSSLCTNGRGGKHRHGFVKGYGKFNDTIKYDIMINNTVKSMISLKN